MPVTTKTRGPHTLLLFAVAWIFANSVFWLIPSLLAKTGWERYGMLGQLKGVNIHTVWLFDIFFFSDTRVVLDIVPFIASVVISIVMTIVLILIYRPTVDKWSSHHAASCIKKRRCPVCGYLLGDQLSRGCPECGWKRQATERESG